MNVSIGHDLEAYIQSKVASGDYASASEVVRDGLRLLKEKDRLLEARVEALRTEIQQGVDQALAGDLLDGPAVLAELREVLERNRSR